MGKMGITGARAGRKRPRTTVPGPSGQEWPSDLPGRDFSAPAPNRRRVADITYVEAASGFVYAAFIFVSRIIVGWQASDGKHGTASLGMRYVPPKEYEETTARGKKAW